MAQTGRPRQFEEDRITKALRIPASMDQRLKEVARERGVSVNVLINAAVDDYLSRLVPLADLLEARS